MVKIHTKLIDFLCLHLPVSFGLGHCSVALGTLNYSTAKQLFWLIPSIIPLTDWGKNDETQKNNYGALQHKILHK